MAEETTKKNARAPDGVEGNDGEARQGEVRRGKTRDAFAFRNFDETKILQRKFFANEKFFSTILSYNRFYVIGGRQLSDTEITDRHFFDSIYDDVLLDSIHAGNSQPVEKYYDYCRNLKRGIECLDKYYWHVHRHIKRLEKLSALLADKILLSDVQGKKLRAQYKRLKKLNVEYSKAFLKIKSVIESMNTAYVQSNACAELLQRKRFAERLKRARQRKNLTQEKLAEILNLSRVGYTPYELAKRDPTLTMLINMSKVLEVSIEWLCGLKD